jgi:hypothetical protein
MFILENVRAGFQGAELALHDPDVMLSKLDVQLCTLTPPVLGTIA